MRRCRETFYEVAVVARQTKESAEVGARFRRYEAGNGFSLGWVTMQFPCLELIAEELHAVCTNAQLISTSQNVLVFQCLHDGIEVSSGFIVISATGPQIVDENASARLHSRFHYDLVHAPLEVGRTIADAHRHPMPTV